MKTKKLSRSSAAVLLFMADGTQLPKPMSKAERRALDTACRKLDVLFEGEDQAPVVELPGGRCAGYFEYEGSGEVALDKGEEAILKRYLDEADHRPFAHRKGRTLLGKLEEEWEAGSTNGKSEARPEGEVAQAA